MTFTIYAQNEDDFVFRYIPRFMLSKLATYKNDARLIGFNSYLKDTYNCHLTAYEILKAALNNIGKHKMPQFYQLDVKYEIITEDGDKVDLVRVIEYGSLSKRGSGIVSEIFNYISDHYNNIEYMYKLGGGY